METIKILDLFRKSIVRDKTTLNVLSILLLNRICTFEEIYSQLKTEETEKHLSAQIAELFKAGLIKKDDNEAWRLSEQAEQILYLLGVDATIAKALIEITDIDITDKIFLKACVDFQEKNKTPQKDTINLLRTIILLKDIWVNEGSFKKDDLKKVNQSISYAIVVYADEYANSIGPDNYASMVLNFHRSGKSYTWQKHSSVLNKHLSFFELHCKESRSILETSNRHFYDSKKINLDNKVSIYFSMNRVFCTLFNESADNELVNIYSRVPNFSSNSIGSITNLLPTVSLSANKKIKNINPVIFKKSITNQITDVLSSSFFSVLDRQKNTNMWAKSSLNTYGFFYDALNSLDQSKNDFIDASQIIIDLDKLISSLLAGNTISNIDQSKLLFQTQSLNSILTRKK